MEQLNKYYSSFCFFNKHELKKSTSSIKLDSVPKADGFDAYVNLHASLIFSNQ